MEYENNTVARIFKVYAILNAVACFIFMYVLIAGYYLDTIGVILWIAASIVVNFGIYAIGEVIQLLDDIKQNTAKARSNTNEDTAANIADELPEL